MASNSSEIFKQSSIYNRFLRSVIKVGFKRMNPLDLKEENSLEDIDLQKKKKEI